MTTIAYRDRTMAGDSQATGGGIITSLVTAKCFKFNGALLGVSGLFGDNLKIIKWFMNDMPAERPKINEDSEAIIVTNKGLFALWEKQFMVHLDDCRFYSIGSGSRIALGAMQMGATPVEAVEAAMEFDIYTGGKIVSFKLGKLE